jgi:hypothetical protein
MLGFKLAASVTCDTSFHLEDSDKANFCCDQVGTDITFLSQIFALFILFSHIRQFARRLDEATGATEWLLGIVQYSGA